MIHLRCLLSFLILVLFPACATLSAKGEKVEVLQRLQSASCKQLPKIEIDDGCPYGSSQEETKAYLRNKAGDIGATHIQFLDVSPYCRKGSATPFTCPKTFGLPSTNLLPMCEQGNADACIDHGANLRDENASLQERLKYYQKACSLGSEGGCKAEREVSERAKLESHLTALTSNCKNKKNSIACLEAASLYYEYGEINSAIVCAQLACSQGMKEGCQIHSNLVNEKAQRTTAALQFIGLQNQAQEQRFQNLLQMQQQQQQQNMQMYQNLFTPKQKTHCVTRRQWDGSLKTECE